ncbi:MAG: DNA repair protein RecN [Clostridiaceae bacterium]|nr:DNA repair protein RecN [Clostridiaceae bacterium]
MISSLQIENIAIIKNAAITFDDGFNCLTGETGAGKSIIIDSLNAILGERTSRELIRTGCDYAEVKAVFYDKSEKVNSVLSQLDIEPEADGSIIISRKMTADGKNNCKINGVTVTVSMLKILGKQLVNIHGQLDNQALLNPEFHCEYVDSIAENSELLENYRVTYGQYCEVSRQLEQLNYDEEQKARRLDTLSFQISEIEAANITVGEYEQLKDRENFFRNAEKLSSFMNASFEALSGNGENEGAVSLSFSAANKLEGCSESSEKLSALAKRLSECAYELSDCSDELSSMLDELDFNEADVNAVEERLDLLYNLSRKYGKTEQDILDYYDSAVKERDSIEHADELRIKLEDEKRALYSLSYEKALLVSASRKSAGKAFCDKVCEELKFLNMPSVKFFVNIDECEMNENGIDSVEFFLSANLGEAPKPLAKIASGGELSRIMLAIKSVLAEKDGISTLVFDEIDTGVSGSSAHKIAVKLKEVSKTHQVICVTHLAQIAAFADEHMLIEKSERDEHTYTDVQSLEYESRVQELARIMGGNAITPELLESARQLLENAKN